MRNIKHFGVIFIGMGAFLFAQDLQKRPEPIAPVIMPAPGKAPNTEPNYVELRNITISGESATVKDLVIKRDAGVFTFKSGTFSFLQAVNGKATGAVFQGEGTFDYEPPIEMEKKSLSRLTKEPVMHEVFSDLLLRFTDGTQDEIRKASGTILSPTGGNTGILEDIKTKLKRQLHGNLSSQILDYVIGKNSGGMFCAFIKGRKYSAKLLFVVDPHGASERMAPEEVMLLNYDEENFGIFSAHHLTDEYKNSKASGTQSNQTFNVTNQDLSVTIERSGNLQGRAITTVVAAMDGIRVLRFDLFAPLRVSGVTGLKGEAMDFIQENKEEDPDFAVILPITLSKGESYSFLTEYAGKDAVRDDGGANYTLVARSNWYPNMERGNYANYHMLFKIPKGMKMTATGYPIQDVDEGPYNTSEWSSRVPLIRAGFTFGETKKLETKIGNYTVEARANTSQPDFSRSISFSSHTAPAMGTLNTVLMMQRPYEEAQVAVSLYSDFFGSSSFTRVSMTQQTPCTFGQSWPILVWIPICAFFDATARHGLGFGEDRGYWTVVGPHEVAHQWWGSTVGWSSYRDQWMSEGFADFSASLFIQATSHNDLKKFYKFWNDEKELMTQKNNFGFRGIDAGPLTLGYRNNNAKTGNVTRAMIYPKGAYVLHMLRMMLWNPRDPNGADSAFKNMMHDFVDTYRNRPASTEDFKAVVEKHMSREMDLMQNHTMDWFFDSYVNGTEFPDYHFDGNVENSPDGVNLKIFLKQSNVSDKFRMVVPIYMELASGKIVKLGNTHVVGNNTFSQTVSLGKIEPPKRVFINNYNDMLCTIDGK